MSNKKYAAADIQTVMKEAEELMDNLGGFVEDQMTAMHDVLDEMLEIRKGLDRNPVAPVLARKFTKLQGRFARLTTKLEDFKEVLMNERE